MQRCGGLTCSASWRDHYSFRSLRSPHRLLRHGFWQARTSFPSPSNTSSSLSFINGSRSLPTSLLGRILLPNPFFDEFLNCRCAPYRPGKPITTLPYFSRRSRFVYYTSLSSVSEVSPSFQLF